jgi:nickel-dependent lactate racemase
MKYKRVRLPQLCWYEDDQVELRFPASWDIAVCYMRGHRRPALTEAQMRAAFSKPIGTKPIRDLARGKKQVAILFDDMSRPTKAAGIVPHILEELKAGGINDDRIRFIAAVGAHGALTRIDFVRKLGEGVLCRFPVYNHNPYENCSYLGNTTRGTPVSVNNEVMSCDLKIGIGSILPHPLTGFGGGSKIILPGVSHIDTMAAHHSALVLRLLTEGKDPGIGLASFEDNLLRLDIVEAAKMAGLDVKIDTVLNGRGQIAGLFVGEPSAEHAEGVRLARDVYATEAVPSPDIVVLNAYAKANEAVLAIPLLAPLLGDRPPDLVLVANAPDGQVPHYLVRSFGKKVGGRLWTAPSGPLQRIDRFIVLTQHIDIAGADWLATPESITWARTWAEVMERLTEAHGEKASVAVVPDATMQYFSEPS